MRSTFVREVADGPSMVRAQTDAVTNGVSACPS
jgi:hypothetical protein